MSITKMTNETAKTTTSTSSTNTTKLETKMEMAHWLNQREENTFKIKQALTFLHFISLIGTAIVYMAHLEPYQGRAVILSFGTFVLAFCIPPIGMISPEDAPDATRKALGWMPERGDLGELKKMEGGDDDEEGKTTTNNNKKKKGGTNKKKKGKKND
ncbi:hypothetical protein ACHAWT_000981 [Skeletonema menzelii]